MNPFFSIILPTFNRGYILDRTIKSVVNQDFKNWELIIIDDGSTDDSKEIVQNHIEKDSRIQYHFQKNAERSVARNNGIEKSSAEYICFLDSDDFYKPNHLKEFEKIILAQKDKIGIFISELTRIENGKEKIVPFESIENFTNQTCFFLQVSESIIPSRVCIHRDILEKHKFQLYKDVEDTILWCEISLGYKVIQNKVASCSYYLHENNSTNIKNNPFLNQLKGLNFLFKKKRIKKIVPKKIRNQKLSNCFMGIAKYHLVNGEMLKFRINILKSMYYRLFNKSTRHKIYLFLKGKQQ